MQEMKDFFGEWWAVYGSKSRRERITHYNSLPRSQRRKLAESLFQNGWAELFFQNEFDKAIQEIKGEFDLDMIDIRVKCILNNEIFMIPRNVWNIIVEKVGLYRKYCNLYQVFGGLSISVWSRDKQFIIIRKKQS